MDFRNIFFSSYELVISLAFGLLTVFIATRFINATLLKGADAAPGLRTNASASLFTGGMILCVLILVQSSVLPSVNALRTMVLGREVISFDIVLISLGYFLTFYLISMVISILLIYASIQIYMTATAEIDEIHEIKKNNIAQAIILTAVLLGMTYFMKAPLARFISSLVDYDSLETAETIRTLPPVRSERYVVPPIKVSPDDSSGDSSGDSSD